MPLPLPTKEYDINVAVGALGDGRNLRSNRLQSLLLCATQTSHAIPLDVFQELSSPLSRASFRRVEGRPEAMS